MFPKRTAALLALILLIALVLRIINLGERSLWYDEAFAVLFAEKGLGAMLYGTLEPVAGGAADIHPLLYYITLNMWMQVWGQDPAAVRLWSVLLGVVTVGLMYGLARDLFKNDSTALAAAAITAVAPFHVQYSQETRMYALLGLLLLAATWCYVRGWRTRRWGWWVGFGVLAGLATYTQQLAAFYLVALALVPVLARRWRQVPYVLVGGLVALVVYLPWLVQLPAQLSKVSAYYWLDSPRVARLLLTLRSFLVVNLDIPGQLAMVSLLGALFVTLFLGVQVVFLLRSRRPQPDRQPLLLVLWLAGGPVALMWLVSQMQPVYLERALLPSALMCYVALAWLITNHQIPRLITGLIVVVGLVLVGIGLSQHYLWDQFPNSPFRTAAEYIEDHWQEGDMVVNQNKLSALPMVYYARDLNQRFIGDAPGSPQDTLALPTQESLGLLADACVQTASQGRERLWWVTFAFADEQYAAANRPEFQQALDWLNAHYTHNESIQFNDLKVSLFTNPDVNDEDLTCPAA